MVSCISVLEHIREHEVAVRNMIRLLKPNGHLVLTCPYSEARYVENVYQLPNSTYGREFPFICQSFSRHELAKWLSESDCVLECEEYWKFFEEMCGQLVNALVHPSKQTAKTSIS